jgi:hypothetical protein
VSLKDGSVVRGWVMSVDPDREVVLIVRGDQEARHISWGQVDKVTRRKYNAAAEPVRGAPPWTQGMVRLHVISDSPEVLLDGTVIGSDGSLSAWRTRLFNAPFDKPLDHRHRYSLWTPGTFVTDELQLGGRGPEVTMKVKAGSRGLTNAALAFIGVGAAGILGGFVDLAVLRTKPMSPHDSTIALAELVAAPAGAGSVVFFTGWLMGYLARTKYSFVAPQEQATTPRSWSMPAVVPSPRGARSGGRSEPLGRYELALEVLDGLER